MKIISAAHLAPGDLLVFTDAPRRVESISPPGARLEVFFEGVPLPRYFDKRDRVVICNSSPPRDLYRENLELLRDARAFLTSSRKMPSPERLARFSDLIESLATCECGAELETTGYGSVTCPACESEWHIRVPMHLPTPNQNEGTQ